MANPEKVEQTDESRLSGEASPSKQGGKKRDRNETGDEVEQVASRQRREERRKANEETKDDSGKEPSKEAASKTSTSEESKEGDSQKAATNEAKVKEEATVEGGAFAGAPAPPAAASVEGLGPLQAAAATAGMPLSSVAAAGGGAIDASQSQPNLMNQYPLLFPYGAAAATGFPGGMAGMADQSRLFQGLVASRGNGNNLQQGQEGGAAAVADAVRAAGQGFAGIPAATLQQLYDPAQMMIGMGFPPAIAGNPFLTGAATMRPASMGGTRLDDLNLASMPTNLYRTPAIPLSLPCDDEHLSEYQILVRQQLELFEAEQEDVDSNTQGRKKQVHLGQVGLRCKHCAGLTLRQRGKGSVYYPTKLAGIYQAAQNMASSHLSDACQCIDERMKATLIALRQRRDTASGGKQYWADGAKALGLYETDTGLRLSRQPQSQQQSL